MTSLLFYRGSGFGAWCVRAFTRSRFAHVAVLIESGGTATVYEAIWSGVRSRPAGVSDYLAVRVDLPNVNPDNAARFLVSQLGKRYDRTALVMDALSAALPAGMHLYDSRQGEDDCSRLAAEAIGLDTLGGRGPVTPQGLYEMVTKENAHG